MQLSKHLLFSEEEFDYNSILNGTTVKGSYSTTQFVVRFRDDIRTALRSRESDFETIQANSTSIHENIHWWQHIGSNFGFLFSLAYPAFAHTSKQNLDNIISQGLTYKSILKFDKEYYQKNGKSDIEDINIILNNYHDLEYAKEFALDNKNIKKIKEDRRFFLNIGHCYHVLWDSTINIIASTIDPKYHFLPNPNNWIENFELLTEKKIPGFVVDAPSVISYIGIKAIYEGQAMFNQMQYLTVALNKDLTYSNFEDVGMLHGVYIEAFELFLNITGLRKPINLLDPIVGLFLLVCDLSINPNNGFPLEIYDFEKFIIKNDPGIRFTLITAFIAKNIEKYIGKLNSYSKEEYIYLSKELSEGINCSCPYESINIVLEWSKSKEVEQVLHEEIEMKFSNENFPIRLMFSKYYRFQEDKFKYPNVLCWFGYHATSQNPNLDFKIVDSLYKKHHALFIDDYDGEIKPTIFENRTEENIKNTFNKFYEFNILYDLILKWIYEEGEFKFDYKWLANERSASFIPFVKEGFKKQFGISLDDISVL